MDGRKNKGAKKGTLKTQNTIRSYPTLNTTTLVLKLPNSSMSILCADYETYNFLCSTLSIWLGILFGKHYCHVADRFFSSFFGRALKHKFTETYSYYDQSSLLIDLWMENCQMLRILSYFSWKCRRSPDLSSNTNYFFLENILKLFLLLKTMVFLKKKRGIRLDWIQFDNEN